VAVNLSHALNVRKNSEIPSLYLRLPLPSVVLTLYADFYLPLRAFHICLSRAGGKNTFLWSNAFYRLLKFII